MRFSLMPGRSDGESAQRAPSRLRSRRMWIFLIAGSITWKLLVLSLGVAIPKWVVGDGISHLPPADRAYAVEAKRTALALWSGPIERHALVRTVRVMSVDSQATVAPTECGGFHARVRAYTYFAIPYSEVRTVCDRGTVEYRVFRRRSPDTQIGRAHV